MRIICYGISLVALALVVRSIAQDTAHAQTAALTGEAAIAERQLVMDQLGKDSEVLGNVVAGLAPKEKLVDSARAVARGARESIVAFRQVAPGGRSKDEVWSNKADFDKKMDSFAKNADAMAVAAEAGNMPLVISMLGDALPCKQCHDVYRTPRR